jgi:hypothetical protein
MYSKQGNWIALAENADHRLVLLVIGIYQLYMYPFLSNEMTKTNRN